MEKQQTAVDFLVEKIKSFGVDVKFLNSSIKKAQQIQKNQLINAHYEGVESTLKELAEHNKKPYHYRLSRDESEQFYNQLYK